MIINISNKSFDDITEKYLLLKYLSMKFIITTWCDDSLMTMTTCHHSVQSIIHSAGSLHHQ